jgi:hypothetical protein
MQSVVLAADSDVAGFDLPGKEMFLDKMGSVSIPSIGHVQIQSYE